MQPNVRRVQIPLESAWTPATLAVLFVSEDADLRCVAARVLTAAGFRAALAAHDGHAVLACMMDAVDVVVLDRQRRGGRDDSLVKALRSYRPDLQVVRLCERAPVDCDGPALVRPFTAEDLISAILDAARVTSSAS